VVSGDQRITYVLHDSGDADAVYELAGSGTLATASGRVWVRFAEGVDAAGRADDLERAGYRLDGVPGFAANAAYVRAEDVGAALQGLDTLRALPDVAHVEPEMLQKRNFRG
jgi:hypothetical protein